MATHPNPNPAAPETPVEMTIEQVVNQILQSLRSHSNLLVQIYNRQNVLFQALDRINVALVNITKENSGMAAQQSTLAQLISGLQTEVANNTTVEGSAVTLLQGLSAQLAAALSMEAGPAQTAALQAIQTQLTTNDTALAAAIVANTPAAPAGTTAAPAGS